MGHVSQFWGGGGEISDTSKCRRYLGLLQGQKQSELTRDPGSLREGAGKGLDLDLEPRLAASQGSTRR